MATALIAGRYLVRRALGTPGAPGGQGEVYEVEDTHEGDVVALKLLTSLPPGGAWAEAQILRQLADPHILPIRNADLHVGQPYLVTELATHGSLLDQVQAAGPRGLDVDDVVRWLRHACLGVARAHGHRLLHNDLKPGNLFLNAERECVVADFGFAALLPPGADRVRPPGITMETVAPEVAAVLPDPAAAPASVASDIYSLGATAYWLLTGAPPLDFSGTPDPIARLAIAATGTPNRLRDLAPHVPHHLAAVIERAMAPDPSHRYSNATALAAAAGSRPEVAVRWRRTDEHAGHLACWRGERRSRGGPYLVCLEVGARPSQRVITTRLASSGRRIMRCCRTTTAGAWAQAVRSVMRALT
ncbi:MAG: serine/threonine-protein kinase [Acidimicrobiales bacterium]